MYLLWGHFKALDIQLNPASILPLMLRRHRLQTLELVSVVESRTLGSKHNKAFLKLSEYSTESFSHGFEVREKESPISHGRGLSQTHSMIELPLRNSLFLSFFSNLFFRLVVRDQL